MRGVPRWTKNYISQRASGGVVWQRDHFRSPGTSGNRCLGSVFRRAETVRLLILAAFALFCMARCQEGARLLASKSLLNGYAVEDRTLHAALNTEPSDDSSPSEDFGVVSGMFNVQWLRIARYRSLSDVSHAATLPPLEAGYFNFTSATMTYLAQEGGQVVVGFVSAPGQGGILAQPEFDRRFSPCFLDWAAFSVITIGVLLLWDLSKRKYDAPKEK